MDEMDCTPSHAQAIKMRQMSEAKTGDERLAKDALVAIMKEEKPNQKEQIKIPKERISKYFAPGTPAQKIEDTIVQALELILSILVDTFSSRISLTMPPSPKPHNTACVLS